MMPEPTVLHVVPSLGIGGAERMLTALVTARRQRPVRSVVVNMMGTGEFGEEIRRAGVIVHDLGLRHPLALPLALPRLIRLIRQTRPVAVQSWLYYADLISLVALERSGLREQTSLYWGVRCSDMDLRQYSAPLRWTVSACARRAVRVDAVVANSYAGRDAHRKLGYAPRAFPVIPNGIDTERFKPDRGARARIRAELGISDDTALVIHVARVDPMKDHQSLLALAGLLPEVRFLAVGSGTQSLDVPPNVTALGARDDVPALYAAADVTISTSRFGEGFPSVLAEAMATGIPAVTTRVGDADRIVGATGEVVAPRDVAAMAVALRRILEQPRAQREARGHACRARVESHFSLQRAVATFDALHLDGVVPDDCRQEPGPERQDRAMPRQ